MEHLFKKLLYKDKAKNTEIYKFVPHQLKKKSHGVKSRKRADHSITPR